MEHKNICNDCISTTGGCCTGVNIILHESEVKPFLHAKKEGLFTESDNLEQFKEQKDLFVYTSGTKRCHFLTDSNTCSIYDSRPTICRLYPIVWKKGIIESSDIFIDLLCPLTHVKPIVDLYASTQNLENQKLIKEIGSLVFNENDSGYLNITDKKRSSDALAKLYKDE